MMLIRHMMKIRPRRGQKYNISNNLFGKFQNIITKPQDYQYITFTMHNTSLNTQPARIYIVQSNKQKVIKYIAYIINSNSI